MALNNFKCYHLMPLHCKGLIWLPTKLETLNANQRVYPMYCYIERTFSIPQNSIKCNTQQMHFDALCLNLLNIC